MLANPRNRVCIEENLTRRGKTRFFLSSFRSKISKALTSFYYSYQEPGWFDRVENQPGVLTARLATEVSSLETVTGAQLGSMLEAICLLIASLVIAFMYSWQLALVNICFMPVIVASSSLQVRSQKHFDGN